MKVHPSVKNKEKESNAKRAKDLYAEADALMQQRTSSAYHQAAQKLTEAIRYRPAFARYFYARGNCYKLLGEYKRAIFDYTMAIQIDDKFSGPAARDATAASSLVPRYYGNRGACFRQLGKLADSLHDFNRALELDPQYGGWYSQLGLSYYDCGDKAKSAAAFTAAIDRISNTHDRAAFKPRLHRGNVLRELGRYEESLADLQAALAIDELAAPAWNALGLTLYEMGGAQNFAAAAQGFSRAIDIDSERAVYANNRGLALLRLGKAPEALQDFDTAIHLEESRVNGTLFYNRGNAHLAAKNHAAALRDFDEARSRQPADEGTYFCKAVTLLELGRVEEAVVELAEALRVRPHFVPALFHLGLAYHMADSLYDAEGALLRALQVAPTDRRLQESLGLVYLDLQFFELAELSFARALEVDNARPANYYYLGRAQLWQGKYKDAVDSFGEAVALGCTDPLVLNARGVAKRYCGDFAGAIEDLTAAVEAAPACVEFLFNRALCRLAAHEHARAEADLTVAIAVDDSEPKLRTLRGTARFQMSAYHDCANDMLGALARSPDGESAHESHFYLGAAYASLGRHSEAIEAFSSALALRPHSARVLHERAKARQCIRQHEEAVADFTAVLQTDPLNAHALFRRAFSHKCLGMFDEAAYDFETARKIQPDNPRLVVEYSAITDVEQIVLCPPGREPPSVPPTPELLARLSITASLSADPPTSSHPSAPKSIAV